MACNKPKHVAYGAVYDCILGYTSIWSTQ